MIPLFDLTRLLNSNKEQLNSAFLKSLEDCRFINGPQVKSFEEQMNVFFNSPGFLGFSSGTDALLAIFMSLGLKPGDEILVPSFTFVSSATSILRAGLKPVFVDSADNSFLPTVKEFEDRWTSKTKGVLFVHLFGEPGRLEELKDLCESKGAFLFEDCAQSLGSLYDDDTPVGTYGDAAAFSFFPAKNLGCLGDGGGVYTNDPALFKKVKMVRNHGCQVKYNHELLGGNFRLDSIQASFLSVLLPNLENWIRLRRENALFYLDALSGINGLNLPKKVKGHSWNQFTIRTERRNELKNFLDSSKIGNAVYYPNPLHKQPIFKEDKTSLNNAELLSKQVLSIPVYPGLTEQERDKICETIRKFYKDE